MACAGTPHLGAAADSRHGRRVSRQMGGGGGDTGHAVVRRTGGSPMSLHRQRGQFAGPLADPPPQIGKLPEHCRDPYIVPVHRRTSHAFSCRSIAAES